MNDDIDNTDGTTDDSANLPTELDLLKERAKKLGITYHPTIGLDKLKLKIDNKLNDIPETTPEVDTVINTPIPQASAIPITTKPKIETIHARNERLRKESSRLVRIRVSCMNPNKKEYEGEVFSISNSVVGTFKKYVPFNNEEGWHVPFIIYEHLLERKCQVFVTKKGPRGNKVRTGKLIKEFAIEVLDPLTSEELKALATRQAMANNLD